MGIMARLMRLFRADIHGLMDLFEDRALLLRQHLRDMEEELTGTAAELAEIGASRDLAAANHEKNACEMEKIEQDIISAMSKEREDIARMLIRKKKILELHQEESGRHIASMDRELSLLAKTLERRRVQYESIRFRAEAQIRRKQGKGLDKEFFRPFHAHFPVEPTEGEIELELMERRDAMGGGEP